MDLAHIHPAAVLECIVVLFQVIGVTGLCLSRLAPGTQWARRGKITFVVALVGLGVAGALCSQHDSAFTLFAGGSLTALLIGMTIGSHPADPSFSADDHVGHELTLGY